MSPLASKAIGCWLSTISQYQVVGSMRPIPTRRKSAANTSPPPIATSEQRDMLSNNVVLNGVAYNVVPGSAKKGLRKRLPKRAHGSHDHPQRDRTVLGRTRAIRRRRHVGHSRLGRAHRSGEDGTLVV